MRMVPMVVVAWSDHIISTEERAARNALHLADPDIKQVVGGLLVQDRDLDTQERVHALNPTRQKLAAAAE